MNDETENNLGADLSQNMLDSLRNTVFETLETMAMAESTLVSTEKVPAFNVTGQISGLIYLTGSHEAIIGISGDKNVIADLISRIIGLPTEELMEEDLLDGVGELANMIGGGMKSKANIPLPANLSPPLAVVSDKNTILWRTNRPVHLFTFRTEEGTFKVHASV